MLLYDSSPEVSLPPFFPSSFRQMPNGATPNLQSVFTDFIAVWHSSIIALTFARRQSPLSLPFPYFE